MAICKAELIRIIKEELVRLVSLLVETQEVYIVHESF